MPHACGICTLLKLNLWAHCLTKLQIAVLSCVLQIYCSLDFVCSSMVRLTTAIASVSDLNNADRFTPSLQRLQ